MDELKKIPTVQELILILKQVRTKTNIIGRSKKDPDSMMGHMRITSLILELSKLDSQENLPERYQEYYDRYRYYK